MIWIVDYPYGARRFYGESGKRHRATYAHSGLLEERLRGIDREGLLEVFFNGSLEFRIRGLAKLEVERVNGHFIVWSAEEAGSFDYHQGCVNPNLASCKVIGYWPCQSSLELTTCLSSDRRRSNRIVFLDNETAGILAWCLYGRCCAPFF